MKISGKEKHELLEILSNSKKVIFLFLDYLMPDDFKRSANNSGKQSLKWTQGAFCLECTQYAAVFGSFIYKAEMKKILFFFTE